MKDNRKITRSDKKLFVIIGITATLIVAVAAGWQWINAMPGVKIPTPKMPSPNAYDFYVKAGAAIIPANPAVDAVHDTQRVPESQWKTRYPTARKEAWLRQNAKSLSLMRQGFKYPSRVPPRRSIAALQNPNTPYAGFRSMARMLIVESHAHRERGNSAGAAKSTLDVLEFGHDIAQDGALIDFLVGAAVNAIADRELWEILPHLNAAQTSSTLQRLEKILKTRVSYADVLREEKYTGQATLLETMKLGGWSMASPRNAAGQMHPGTILNSLVTSRRAVFNSYTSYMDALIAHAQKPYATKTSVPAIPNDIYSQLVAPVYDRSRWNYARSEAKGELFLVALALHAHKLEHNRYPQTLNELVPRYLKKVPADPFGGGEPLRYKLSGAKYSLYSIGADGIDNNGRAVENTKISKAKRNRFLMKPESKGDMVAGINY